MTKERKRKERIIEVRQIEKFERKEVNSEE